MDSWGAISFDVHVDRETGAYPLPEYRSSGSVQHVPNSTIDIIQYTGTGRGVVTYSIELPTADYDLLVAAMRTIPRASETLTVGSDLGEWYIDRIAGAVQLLDGSVICSVTFRARV